ncbi:MAG: glycosyltransferase [Phycisphaerae bacterium]|jgi:rhamnosyltransferase|nr:glycosyltransferase [Phycisphaerae bacterium]
MEISVIIPTLNAGKKLSELLDGLKTQTLPPGEIIIVDSSSTDDTLEIAEQFDCVIRTIPSSDFDHGGSRNLGARLARGEILIFMTQDARPCDQHLLESLTAPLRNGGAAAAYARQIANSDAIPPEAFAREINYPPQSRMKTIDDLAEMGIKTFFFSNATSAITKHAFEAIGEFPENVVVNEDMLFSARLLKAGLTVAYQADAHVFHSHNYSLVRQFKRYFDIGAFTAQASGDLSGVGTNRQGREFVFQQLRFLLSAKKYLWFLRACADNCLRYLGFTLGRCHKYLPKRLRKRLSMHPEFWDRQ